MSQGTPLQQAILWISEQMKNNPSAERSKLIDEAGQMFNLSPRDSEILRHTVKSKEGD